MMVITQKITSVAFEIHDGKMQKCAFVGLEYAEVMQGDCVQTIVNCAFKGLEKLIKEMEAERCNESK